MSVIGSNILAGASGNQGGAYNIDRSLRFRSSATAYLNRTPASAGNRKTWTWSGWVKLGKLSTYQLLFSAGTNSNGISFESDGTFAVDGFYDGTRAYRYTSNAVWRDPSAWYHIVVALDTTQATDTNRIKLYVNGTQVSLSGAYVGTWPAQNSDGVINNNVAHSVGRRQNIPDAYFDGYLAENHFIDGQALDASSFGETSTTTGVWIPKAYTGTYGTNGFYLDFEDTTSTTTLGYDAAGSNDWTVNNVSLTSGATYDSMTDVPTLTSATAANYCVMNPLIAGGAATSNGNLLVTGTSGQSLIRNSTLGITTGKFYCEMTVVNVTSVSLGFAIYSASALGVENGSQSRGYFHDGQKYSNGSLSAYGNSYTNGDVIGIAIDLDNSKIWFSKNGTFQASGDPVAGTNAAFTDVTSNTWFVTIQGGDAYSAAANFGQQPFTYTPPSGFVALNTFNLPTPTIGATASSQANKYFDAKLYTGTGSSLSVTGYGFSPDFVWIKERSGVADHALYDAVRGVQIQLESNTTTAETTETTGLTALNSDGFTVGALAQVNTNTDTYVAWAWDANGAGSSNTDGTITSTVSANTSAGFSIVTYTGTGANATVGHGLGVAPSMVIVKNRDAADAWQVYHAANTAAPETDYLVLNTDAATADAADRWNDTLPTSTVFSIGNGVEVNTNTEKYVAYCFAEVAGYSKFGSYTGNGSADGTFVYTGFRPKFLLIKTNAESGDWQLWDSSRGSFNVNGPDLYPNSSAAEATVNAFDFLSNGFKMRIAASPSYIYAAFAENPFKYANAR